MITLLLNSLKDICELNRLTSLSLWVSRYANRSNISFLDNLEIGIPMFSTIMIVYYLLKIGPFYLFMQNLRKVLINQIK